MRFLFFDYSNNTINLKTVSKLSIYFYEKHDIKTKVFLRWTFKLYVDMTCNNFFGVNSISFYHF